MYLPFFLYGYKKEKFCILLVLNMLCFLYISSLENNRKKFYCFDILKIRSTGQCKQKFKIYDWAESLVRYRFTIKLTFFFLSCCWLSQVHFCSSSHRINMYSYSFLCMFPVKQISFRSNVYLFIYILLFTILL